MQQAWGPLENTEADLFLGGLNIQRLIDDALASCIQRAKDKVPAPYFGERLYGISLRSVLMATGARFPSKL